MEIKPREQEQLKEEIKRRLIPICTRFRHDNFNKNIVKQIVEDIYDELENYI